MGMGGRVIDCCLVSRYHFLNQGVDLTILTFPLVYLLLGLKALDLHQVLLALNFGVTSNSDRCKNREVCY